MLDVDEFPFLRAEGDSLPQLLARHSDVRCRLATAAAADVVLLKHVYLAGGSEAIDCRRCASLSGENRRQHVLRDNSTFCGGRDQFFGGTRTTMLPEQLLPAMMTVRRSASRPSDAR